MTTYMRETAPVTSPGGSGSSSTTYFRVQPTTGLGRVDLHSLWDFRELLLFLTWRDISIRYKQTLLGAAWTILQPVLTMALFTIVFGNFAKMPSDGLPYSLFAFAALVPWTFFSQAISRSSVSLVNDPNLIKKVYFPRLLIPLSSAAAPLVDFLVCFVVLLLMMMWYGIPLRWNLLSVPVLLSATLFTALAVAVWLAPLNARYRDIAYAIPFVTQFWFYASPIAYPLSLVPVKWRLLYSLNPLVGIIEGFRWALLGSAAPDPVLLISSGLVVVALLVSGVLFFKSMERTLSDVI
jgi:lipopolysaccharide transport system permease protein